MVFQEKKIQSGYSYFIEDVFGEVLIKSPEKLTGELLDSIISLLLKQNSTAQKISGEVKLDNGLVSYEFNKAPMWKLGDDEDEDICKDTLTSTKKPENVFIQTKNSLIKTLFWPKRFAVAFLEAYRKVNK